jgi:hypothetical protein
MTATEDLPEQLISALASVCSATGSFEWVNQHEPKGAPEGLGAAVWIQSMAPAAQRSGLNATSVRFECSIRIYTNMLQEPQDYIDPAMTKAAWRVMVALTGGITLNGQVEYIDILGSDGAPLAWEAGYIDIDKRMFRVITITVPMVIEDAWVQAR